jgi:hypothetical protein
MGPTSYSCHEVKNGYAIPTHATLGGCRPMLPKTVTPSENFYAATDIVLKVGLGCTPVPPCPAPEGSFLTGLSLM